MEIDELKNDIKIMNQLLDAVQLLMPNAPISNQLVNFIKQIDQNELLLNVVLLMINNLNLQTQLKKTE